MVSGRERGVDSTMVAGVGGDWARTVGDRAGGGLRSGALTSSSGGGMGAGGVTTLSDPGEAG